MIATAITAVLLRDPSPRSTVLPLSALYLGWALLDSLLALHGSRPRAFLIVLPFLVVALGGAVLVSRARDLKKTAAKHNNARLNCLMAAARVEQDGEYTVGCLGCQTTDPHKTRTVAAGYREWAREEQVLAAKYEYAATHPWLPVAPDPSKSK
jgi:hypothetical protein